MPMIHQPQAIYNLLEKLDVSKRLLKHLHLVGEAAERLILGYQQLAIPCDASFIRLGVAYMMLEKFFFQKS